MTQIYDCQDPQQREHGLAAAVEEITSGRLVVIPTDTVYGLAADAFSPEGVEAVFTAKGRDRSMPPPVLVPNRFTVDGLAMALPSYAHRLMDAFWPGGLTLVVRAQQSLSWDLGDTNGTVGLRMPDDEVALALLERTGPLAVSSANRTGRAPATSVTEAGFMLGPFVEVYLDGGERLRTEASTVLDCTKPDPLLLREGVISADRLRQVLGDVHLVVPGEPLAPPPGASPAGASPAGAGDAAAGPGAAGAGAAGAGASDGAPVPGTAPGPDAAPGSEAILLPAAELPVPDAGDGSLGRHWDDTAVGRRYDDAVPGPAGAGSTPVGAPPATPPGAADPGPWIPAEPAPSASPASFGGPVEPPGSAPVDSLGPVPVDAGGGAWDPPGTVPPPAYPTVVPPVPAGPSAAAAYPDITGEHAVPGPAYPDVTGSFPAASPGRTRPVPAPEPVEEPAPGEPAGDPGEETTTFTPLPPPGVSYDTHPTTER